MKKAFTLIELLVVIAIIALLLAILLPSLNIAKEKAAGVVCLSNLNNLGKAWYTYTSENDQEMVKGHPTSLNSSANGDWVCLPQTASGAAAGNSSSTIEEKINGIRKGALYPYLNDHKVYHCRGDKRMNKPPKSGGSGDGAYRTYSIPCGLNGVNWPSGFRMLTKLTQLRSTDSKYVFVEEMDGRGINSGAWAMDISKVEWIDPVAVWHNISSTLAYADGHADSYKWRGKKLINMTNEQTFWSGTLTDPLDIEDYEFMKRGYAHEGNK